MADKERIGIATLGVKSVEDQLAELNPQQLVEQIRKLNGKLGNLGVKVSVADIVNGAYMNGYRYEDRRYPSGAVRLTSMNWFMSLIHQQPGLKKLPQEEFEQLGQAVSHLALTTDELLIKAGGSYEWPEDLKESPVKKSTK